jgi:hypothetical protein
MSLQACGLPPFVGGGTQLPEIVGLFLNWRVHVGHNLNKAAGNMQHSFSWGRKRLIRDFCSGDLHFNGDAYRNQGHPAGSPAQQA